MATPTTRLQAPPPPPPRSASTGLHLTRLGITSACPLSTTTGGTNDPNLEASTSLATRGPIYANLAGVKRQTVLAAGGYSRPVLAVAPTASTPPPNSTGSSATVCLLPEVTSSPLFLSPLATPPLSVTNAATTVPSRQTES
ncbi:unnamed protein product [Protopolystoma xenopodis]|uniref:Uncharacterized protein n=1 Tax=Protopolystoma xenopodis TaxID=117903 RepID=A0A448WJT9_9PLAT|nr:unnamed protein product [Protopolystoma xenopodis]